MTDMRTLEQVLGEVGQDEAVEYPDVPEAYLTQRTRGKLTEVELDDLLHPHREPMMRPQVEEPEELTAQPDPVEELADDGSDTASPASYKVAYKDTVVLWSMGSGWGGMGDGSFL